jgi:hypothetical protein
VRPFLVVCVLSAPSCLLCSPASCSPDWRACLLQKLAVELGRAATLEETAAEVHLSTAQVRLLLAASQEVASLEQGGPALLNQMLANGQRLAEYVEKREDPNMDKDPYEVSPPPRSIAGQEGSHQASSMCPFQKEEGWAQCRGCGLGGVSFPGLLASRMELV